MFRDGTTRWCIATALWLGTGHSPTLADTRPDEQDQKSEAPSTTVSDAEFHLANPPELTADIKHAISDLGHPDFGKRKQATRRLLQIGVRAFAQLRDAYHTADDLEVRLRIESIVYQSYLDEHLSAKNGFLGVRIASVFADLPRGLIPPEGVGISIELVVANSAADRAGLKRGDVAIKLDGEPIKGGQTAFRDAIRFRRRGETLRITVLRGRKVYEFEVILGGRPVDTFTGDLAPERAAVERQFRPWWVKHFARSDTAAATQAGG